MKKLGIEGKIRRKWRTPKYIKHAQYDNILDRRLNCDTPQEKFVCDVTEISCPDNNRYYLLTIMDLYNGEIVDYKYSNKNDNNLVIPVISNIANNILLYF